MCKKSAGPSPGKALVRREAPRLVPRPTDEQLVLLRVIDRTRVAAMLGVDLGTVHNWYGEAARGNPELFDRSRHPATVAACKAIETHYRSLAERVPEIVDAFVDKILSIARSEIMDPKVATEQLNLLVDYIICGKLVPIPMAADTAAITDTSRNELLARIRVATASALVTQLEGGK